MAYPCSLFKKEPAARDSVLKTTLTVIGVIVSVMALAAAVYYLFRKFHERYCACCCEDEDCCCDDECCCGDTDIASDGSADDKSEE